MLIGGIACAYAVGLKFRFGFDDALDVVGVHAVDGITGALLIGFLAEKTIDPAASNGLLAGGELTLLGSQAIAVAAAMIFLFGASWILLKIVEATIGLRVSHEEELIGLDKGQHKEEGYVFNEPAPRIKKAKAPAN